MTKTENLLTILAEECVETAQRCSKAIRFSLEEVQPDLNQNPQQLTNAQRIVYEFNDILAVMELLYEEGLIPEPMNNKYISEKKAKIAKYLDYSIKLGTVEM